MKESILKTLEEEKSELLSFTKRLIEVPTGNPAILSECTEVPPKKKLKDLIIFESF